MYLKNFKKYVVLSSTLLLMFGSSLNSYASSGGPGTTAGDSQILTAETKPETAVNGGVPKSKTPAASWDGIDLDSIVASAGLDAVGDGHVTADSILGVLPFVHYGMWNVDNAEIAGTESHLNTYLYNKEGFSRLYLNHTGVGRYYYRAYTLNHGWFPWSNSKEPTPNDNDADKLQAVQIRVKGYTGNLYDIYYKVVLNDGTVLDWAKNGQTSGDIGSGRYIVALRIVLWNKEVPFPYPTTTLTQGSNYEGTYLSNDGRILYSKADGSPYTGWGIYENKQYYFIDSNPVSGWQYVDGYKYYFNDDGSLNTDLEGVMGLTGDYQIKYNKATKTMYVMAKDGANGYIIPYKTFMTTNGPSTPLGSYKTYVKYRWKFMHDNIYCQFLTRFYNGFLIHSLIYYDAPNLYKLDPNTYNYMDDAQSDGCIRLQAKDAAWIYHNVPLQTSVTIYEDVWNKGPVEKPAIDTPIPASQNYDPTDPVITGA